MYGAQEESARAKVAAQHEESEKERWDFIKKLEAEQTAKRKKKKIPMSHMEVER